MSGPGRTRGRRFYLFRALVVLPLLLLLAVTAILVVDLVRVSRVSTSTLNPWIVDVVERKQAAARRGDHDVTGLVPIPALDPAQRHVFVFGGSSVVFTTGETFAAHLQRRLRAKREKVTVSNFGYAGIDSHRVRRLQRHVFDRAGARPDLVVLYMGHNDFINAYHDDVTEPYHLLLPLTRLVYAVTDQERGGITTFEGFTRVHNPVLVKAFQGAGLVRIHDERPRPFDAVITAAFMENLRAMVAAAHRLGARTLVLTPVGNLRREPYGDIEAVTAPWERGLATANYGASIRLLEQARDAELITLDIRAKTPMIQAIRALRAEGATVLDLETRLKARRFAFGPDDFQDYVHLTDSSHRIIAAEVERAIMDADLLQESPAAGAPR